MKEELQRIKDRNRKVEADKAWETSKTRRLIIAVMTYFVVVVFLYSIDAPGPFVNAFVPVLGFVLSTLTLSYFKRMWIRRAWKKSGRIHSERRIA